MVWPLGFVASPIVPTAPSHLRGANNVSTSTPSQVSLAGAHASAAAAAAAAHSPSTIKFPDFSHPHVPPEVANPAWITPVEPAMSVKATATLSEVPLCPTTHLSVNVECVMDMICVSVALVFILFALMRLYYIWHDAVEMRMMKQSLAFCDKSRKGRWFLAEFLVSLLLLLCAIAYLPFLTSTYLFIMPMVQISVEAVSWILVLLVLARQRAYRVEHTLLPYWWAVAGFLHAAKFFSWLATDMKHSPDHMFGVRCVHFVCYSWVTLLALVVPGGVGGQV
jgi:hypothetical protein